MENKWALTAMVERNYNKLRSVVYHRAFVYYINKEDLLSAVNYKIGKAIEADNFVAGSEDQFWAYMHVLINNTATDYKRRQAPEMDDIYEMSEIKLATLTYQPDYELKQFSEHISLELIKRLSKNERNIFKPYFIDGMKYEEVAKETGINLGTVKGLIRRVRVKANNSFGKQYKSLVA